MAGCCSTGPRKLRSVQSAYGRLENPLTLDDNHNSCRSVPRLVLLKNYLPLIVIFNFVLSSFFGALVLCFLHFLPLGCSAIWMAYVVLLFVRSSYACLCACVCVITSNHSFYSNSPPVPYIQIPHTCAFLLERYMPRCRRLLQQQRQRDNNPQRETTKDKTKNNNTTGSMFFCVTCIEL